MLVEWRERGFVQDSDEEEDATVDSQTRQHEASLLDAQHLVEDVSRNISEASVILSDGDADELGHDDESRNTTGDEKLLIEGEQHLKLLDNDQDVFLQDRSTQQRQPDEHVHIDINEVDELQQDSGHVPSLMPVVVLEQLHPAPTLYGIEELELSDVPSSPLSELPESLSPPEHILAQRLPLEASQPIDLRYSSARELAPDITNGGQHDQSLITNATARGLRKRNPIQLHPYLLENEQYRQTLRARGLKPIALHQEQTRLLDRIGDPESQGQDQWQESQGSQESHISNGETQEAVQQNSPDEAQLSSPRQHGKIVYDDDGFPDLDASIDRRVGADGTNSHKRRRINDTLNRPVAQYRDKNPKDTTKRSATPNASTRNVFDLPLGSPLDNQSHVARSTTQKRRRVKKFRRPKGFRSDQLPTPAASSEVGKVSLDTLEMDSESDIELQARRQAREASSGSSVYSQQSNDTAAKELRLNDDVILDSSQYNEPDQLKDIRRKMKGVLPASWLRLDINNRPKPPAEFQRRSHEGRPADQAIIRKGVAQKKIKTPRPSLLSSALTEGEVFTVLAEPDFEGDSDAESSGVLSLNNEFRHINEAASTTSVRARVEAMLDSHEIVSKPKHSYSRQSFAGNKKQLRLTDAFQRLPQSPLTPKRPAERIFDSASSRDRPVPSRRRTRTKRRIPPKISILDVTQNLQRPSVPDFVRIACRRARRATNKGRQSPSTKVLSLHRWEDQNEIDTFLLDWRQGHISNVDDTNQSEGRQPTSLPREPLRETTQNRYNARRPRSTVGSHARNEEEKADSRLSATSQFRHMQQRQPRLKQTRLRAIISDLEARERATNDANLYQQQKTWKRESSRETETRRRRPGQLEDTQSRNDIEFHDTAFQRELLALNERHRNESRSGEQTANPILDRFLMNDQPIGSVDADIPTFDSKNEAIELPKPTRAILRQPRKRKPRRITPDESLQLRYLGEDSDLDHDYHETIVPLTDNDQAQKPLLTGLSGFGNRFSLHFGVKQFPAGTFFQSSTFIGSGDFRYALQSRKHVAQSISSSTTIKCGDRTYEWGLWQDEVLVDLIDMSSSIQNTFDDTSIPGQRTAEVSISSEDAVNTLRSLVKFFTNGLNFHDPIDAYSCAKNTVGVLEQLHSYLKGIPWQTPGNRQSERNRLQCLALLSVLAFKIHQLLLDSDDTRNEICLQSGDFLSNTLQTLTNIILEHFVYDIKTSIKDMEDMRLREPGLGQSSTALEALIILNHLCDSIDHPDMALWLFINQYFSTKSVSTSSDFGLFEQVWQDFFTILPCLHFNACGILSHRPPATIKSWDTVKEVLGRVFHLYTDVPNNHSRTINAYIRTLLGRCYVLVDVWGFAMCETILILTFDFFARNGLAHLRNEDKAETDTLLEELDKHETPKLKPENRSFEIFLKFLVIGLTSMRAVYSGKKIKNIAWRFIPNHGRTHEKVNDLREDDLDALRNHHNILAVLFYASPPFYRINIDLIRNLVDFKSSHSEVCQLNIRNWTNLTRYFLGLESPDMPSEQFSNWFNDISSKLLSQHRQARIEAETLIQDTAQDTEPVLRPMVEPVIASNQSQIERLLRNLLGSFTDLLRNSKIIASGIALFEQTKIAQIFELFDPGQTRVHSTLSLAFDTYQAYYQLLERSSNATGNSNDESEESQEFGDWSVLDDIEDGVGSASLSRASLDESIQRLLYSALSNFFGTDHIIDDALLKKSAETWIMFAYRLVKFKGYGWGHFISQHGSGSWSQLRDTEASRKFTPLVFAKVIELDQSVFQSHEETVLTAYLTSLVERESMLKYQHIFTAALLNLDRASVFENLPFSRDFHSGRFEIALQDLRGRRLSLISTIFLNIRTKLETTFLNSSADSSEMRIMYTAVLKSMMIAMKRNYQEMQQGSNAKGSYVDFVQRVVESLQQYTSEFCPVDRFFTDSAAFPLPTHDPNYVVARIKAYGFKLDNESTQKQLAVFIQAVCERAVMEKQEIYLVKQLAAAMKDELCSTQDPYPLDLRQILFQGVFPAYLAIAISTECGWLLALPMLETIHIAIEDLMFNFNVVSETAARHISNLMELIISSLLHYICGAVVQERSLLQRAYVLQLLISVSKTFTASTPLIDFIQRSFPSLVSRCSDIIIQGAEFFEMVTKHFSLVDAWTTSMASYNTLLPPESIDWVPRSVTSNLGALQTFCQSELSSTLSNAWRHASIQGQEVYWVQRGNSARRDISPSKILTLEEAQVGLVEAANELLSLFD